MIEVVFGWSTRISKAKHSQKLRCRRLNSMLEYLFILPEITPNGMKHTVVGSLLVDDFSPQGGSIDLPR